MRAGANPEGVVAAEPYQVLGTLFDQIAYPAESSEGLTRQRAIEILDEVELSYLADRPDIFEKETNWEEEISLGEKQRLGESRNGLPPAVSPAVVCRPFAANSDCAADLPRAEDRCSG